MCTARTKAKQLGGLGLIFNREKGSAWHNKNTLALREVRAVRTDPLAGVRLDKHVSVYLTDMDSRTSNSVRVPSRPMFEREPDVDTNTSPRSKLTVVGVNRRSAENRVHRQYWTGVPVHEYDVIMPGGMSYGLRTASCGTVLPGKGVRYLGNAAINQRTAVLRQRRREIAILTVRVDTERIQKARERMRLHKAARDRARQAKSAQKLVQGNGIEQRNKRRWSAWSNPPQWGTGAGGGNAPASGGAKAPPQTGDDDPAAAGASGTGSADAARACGTRKRQRPTSKPTPPTSTPTTAETRHQTRDTKKQRQQQPDGSNKTAKRGRGGGTSMERWLQSATPKGTKRKKKKSIADDQDNSRQ